MIFRVSRTALRAGAIFSLTLFGSQAVQAQQILSAVDSEYQDIELFDAQVSRTAGALVATTFGGSDTRALTDFGVNKIHAAGNNTHKQFATSAWLDSYTVGGAAGAMVDLNFTVTIDGMANPINDGSDLANYNFRLFALRGTDWSLLGEDRGEGNIGYNRLKLELARSDGGFQRFDAREFNGIDNYDADGRHRSRTEYDRATDSYSIRLSDGTSTVLSPTELRRYNAFGQQIGNAVLYNGASAASVNARNARANVVANYLIPDMAQFCDSPYDACGILSTSGTDVTVSLKMLVGSTFSVAGYLYADDVHSGTVDFFNTAKMTGISVSQGGSLTSASGSLVDLGNGQYGYAAALAAVPEPSAWALLILGFGMTGAALRRRTVAAVRGRAMLRGA